MASSGERHRNLEKFQCLFSWDKRVTDSCEPHHVIITVKDKLLTSGCAWQTAIYHLVLCYEYSSLEGCEQLSRSHLIECDNILQTANWFGGDSALLERTKIALQHVIYSSWVHLILQTHTLNEIVDYLTEVPEYKLLSKKDKAAVWGIRSACLMQYGREGIKAASKYIDQALKFDPDEAEWHYIKGEILREERFRQKDEELPPCALEISSLEQAVALGQSTSPAHVISLASSLHDSVRKEKGISVIRTSATEFYKSALENWPNSAYVQLMCASGLLEYAYPVRDTALAYKCLLKALQLAPESCHVNLVAGTYYWWPAKKKAVASGHLAKAKKRYEKIIENIINERVTSYRSVLRCGIWGDQSEVMKQTVLP